MGSKKHRHHSGGSSRSGGGSGGGSNNSNKSNKESSSSTTSSSSLTHHHNGHDDVGDDNNNLDWCQRFFGDELFSNFNVTLLFLFATIVPMIVWIPHFLSEYKRLRHIQHVEEERQYRLQRARGEILTNQQLADIVKNNVESKLKAKGNSLIINGQEYNLQSISSTAKVVPKENNNIGGGVDNDGITILQDDTVGLNLNTKSTNIHFPDPNPIDSHGGGHNSGGEYQGGSGSGSSSSNNGSIEYNKPSRAAIPPTLCSDGVTMGYDNWYLLRDAVQEVNSNAAEEFIMYSEYLARLDRAMEMEYAGEIADPVYIPPEPFVICPGVTLTSKSPYRSIFSPIHWAYYFWAGLIIWMEYFSLLPATSDRAKYMTLHRTAPTSSKKNKLSPIFINAEDIIIECDMCTVDLPGTHFSFGPHAKNVLIKGITFKGATSSSLTFHHHGADVSMEDCYWLYNSGATVNNRNVHANVNGNEGVTSTPAGTHTTTTAGAVADLNSTSMVKFYRCVIDDVKQNPKRTTTGAGVANVPGMNPPAGHNINQVNNNQGGVVSSSLTIRN